MESLAFGTFFASSTSFISMHYKFEAFGWVTEGATRAFAAMLAATGFIESADGLFQITIVYRLGGLPSLLGGFIFNQSVLRIVFGASISFWKEYLTIHTTYADICFLGSSFDGFLFTLQDFVELFLGLIE